MPELSRESGSLRGGFAPPSPKYAALRNETAIQYTLLNSHLVPLRVSTEGVFQRTLGSRNLWFQNP